MTERKIYIGSVGPFLFDDTDAIDDEDGDFAGELMSGIVTDAPPVSDNQSVRLVDLNDALLLLGSEQAAQSYFFSMVI